MASVALIDVVMETDHAGLELCQYIREVMQNRFLQIFVRTGQPGVAPERTVIDRYDIQGYLSKAEATEDKLYTVVKAGARTSYYLGLSTALQDLVHFLLPAAASRSRIVERMHEWERLARRRRAGGEAETISAPLCYIVDDQVIEGLETWADDAVALARRDEARRPAFRDTERGGRPLHRRRPRSVGADRTDLDQRRPPVHVARQLDPLRPTGRSSSTTATCGASRRSGSRRAERRPLAPARAMKIKHASQVITVAIVAFSLLAISCL